MAVPTGMKGTTRKHGPPWPVTVGLYGALFLFGAVQGLIGSFQYSRVAGSVPVAALVCCAVILATCLLASWATRSVSGAVVPGIGWIIASFVLSMPVSNGSVIITSTTAGQVVPVRRHALRGGRGGRVVHRRGPLGRANLVRAGD